MATATYYIGPQDGWTRVIEPGLIAYARISSFPHTHPFFVFGDPSATPSDADNGVLVSDSIFAIQNKRGDEDGFWVRVVNPNAGSIDRDGRTRFDVYTTDAQPAGPSAEMLSILSGISQLFNTTVTTPPAPAVKTDGYTGSTVTYTVGTDVASGKLIAKMWGGGGGGTYNAGTSVNVNKGSGAGYQTAAFNLVNGDIITLKVAQGGKKCGFGNGASSSGGLGGYPDGGNGGSLSPSVICAGGGGSTQLFLNGTLIAVAGGGGGGAPSAGGAFGTGLGEGGGTTGTDSSTGTHGGGQTTGGLNDNFASESGGDLQGGNGYATGNGPTQNATTDKGGGGGGGKRGGAGGGNAAVNSLGSAIKGAGGSSYANTAHAAYVAASASTTAGSGVNAGNNGDVSYANNAGRGGAATDGAAAPPASTVGTDGDNGRSVLSFGN